VIVSWIRGSCWRCDNENVPVLWVGPAQWEGQHAPIYLCETCLAAVQRKIRSYFLHRRPNSADPVIFRLEYVPGAAHPTVKGNSMHDARLDDHGEPVQTVSVFISDFGVRMDADGRTGREAWRIIRRRHPRLAMLCTAYVAVLLIALLTAIVVALS
jgi:hypothetical protein